MCKVIAVTNRNLCTGSFLEQIRVLCLAGVDRIILREKDLTKEAYEALARQVLAVCREYGTECFLHQQPEVAEKLGVKGLHLSLPVAMEYWAGQQYAERQLSIAGRSNQESGQVASGQRDWKLGISTHSVEQLRKAEECGADYVFFGHVFPTDCKKGLPPRGLESLRMICRQAKVPVYAIGGISRKNAGQAIEAGASGVCVMSFGMQQREETIRAFVEQCKK